MSWNSNNPCANCISSFTGSCDNYCAYYAQNKTPEWIMANREKQNNLFEETRRDFELRKQFADSYPSDEEVLKKAKAPTKLTTLEVEQLKIKCDALEQKCESYENYYQPIIKRKNDEIEKYKNRNEELEGIVREYENLSLFGLIGKMVAKMWK